MAIMASRAPGATRHHASQHYTSRAEQPIIATGRIGAAQGWHESVNSWADKGGRTAGRLVGRAVRTARAPKVRRRLRVALAAFGLLLVAALLAVPPIARRVLTGAVADALHRPITVGTIRFNPLSLALTLDDLRVAEADGSSAFVEVRRLVLNLSFTSAFRRAPVLDALTIEAPVVHLTRLAAARFNLSDLLAAAPDAASAPAEPARYALANIALHDGRIEFDDRVLGTTQRVEHIEVGVPFLANLPSASAITVEPLLAFEIDGQPQRIEGTTKPFADSKESVLDFHLNGVDLARGAAYVAGLLPVKLQAGTLSGALQLHFVQQADDRHVSLSGTAVVDGLDLLDHHDAPLLALAHAQASLADVQPLRRVARLHRVQLEGLAWRLRCAPAVARTGRRPGRRPAARCGRRAGSQRRRRAVRSRHRHAEPDRRTGARARRDRA